MADWNADLFVKLYSKMALALGVTPSPSPNQDTEMLELFEGQQPPRPRSLGATQDSPFLLAIYNPGQYIPPQMDPATKVVDRYALSVLFDVVPQFSWVFKPAATTVSNAYKSILDYKEAPLVSLTPAQKEKLDAAQTYYDANQADYYTYMDKYMVALDNYDAAYATFLNGGDPVPRSLKLKVKAAYDQWVAHHKEGVESAIAVIAQFEALEPSTFWYKLLDRYNQGTQESDLGTPFQVVGFSPPYKTWFQDAGWTTFTFDQKDMDNQSNSDVIGVSGNLDLTFGIFKVSGSGNYNEDSSYKKMDQTTLNFSCQLMRVSLDRTWMNPLVFSSSAWRWAKGTPVYGTQFSSGADIQGDIAPQGSMTVIPTAAILSRNVKVSGAFDNTIVQDLNRQISADASVGIGPFAIAGRFNMEHHEGSQKGTIASDGIEAKDVQIVALVCEILPKSPNPDNNLPWPS
ncbi:MAG TPA: hypothetical protein VEX13_04740 [Chloroflexia bacterium]|nr:hypothetical protein [Chloroflexia bacterium]